MVFKGRVEYYPEDNHIVCVSTEDCFIIKLAPATKVTTRGDRKRYGASRRAWLYYGGELWANGERYWVKP